MSSRSPSMSTMEIEESSDTSHEVRNTKSRHHRPASTHQQKSRQIGRNFAHPPPSPVGSMSYGVMPGGVYISGSPYSTSVIDHPATGSVPAYSMWGSDSSQLYRPGSGGKDVSEKKQVCSTLLITTAALVVMAVLAIAAVAAYLGVMTNHSDGDKYEIEFDCSLRISRGDNFRLSLADPASPQFRTKSDRYRRLIDNVYKASPLSESYRRCSVERFTNGSLIVHFRLFFDRRKIPVQIGETESSVRDVMVQEVMAVEPVAFKAVAVDIDSIKVERHIPPPAMLSQGPRSRLQIADVVEEEDDVDEDKENSLDNEPVPQIDFEDDVAENPSNTTEDESLFTTDADVDINSENSNHHSVERTTESSLPTEKLTTTAVRIVAVETRQTTASAVVVPTQDPQLTYDDTEWKPLFVNTRTNTGSSLARPSTTTTMTPLKPPVSVATHNHSPAHEDDPDIYKIGLENHALEPAVAYDIAEEKGHQLTTHLPSDVKQDRIIANIAQDGSKDVAVDEDETPTAEVTSPATPTKFSFLQWFNSQLNNVKLAQNRQQLDNSTTDIAVSNGPTSPSRFFTIKPTAVSYTGIQPIMRPKPWEENSTDATRPDFQTLPIGPLSVAGFIVSTMNRSNTDVILPQSFQVQTSLTLANDREKLVESPRSQKSFPLPDTALVGKQSPDTTRNPRELNSERQEPVESLTDFFPPVRRPLPRPQVSKSGAMQRDNLSASLPIEGLFSTSKPQGSHAAESSKHRSNNNSPIYTFKLNQGQSVHDVLSQLLADLTVGESPAQVEIDGAAPSLTLVQQQEQLENNDMKNKASNKKVDDDRLKPWTHMPFRPPAILNALYHNTRNPNSSNSNSANVEVSTPTVVTSAAPSFQNEDTSVTTSTEIATNGLTSSTQQPVTSFPAELTTTVADCDDQFRCASGECVSLLARCNQMSDCRDGSDELNCTCSDFLRAQFLSRKICDGIVDCWDYSDENQCEWCRPGQYICPNSKVCIDRNLICNGIRDCPNGDDERHCIALAHHLDSTEEMSYSNSGYLMVRREGRWGKLCMQNFETAVEKLRQSFQVNDLGKAVCRELTFTGLERAERKLDSSRSNQDSSYFELVESGNEDNEYENIDEDGDVLVESPRTSMLDYTSSKCAKRQVVHVQCRDLECGVRPQLVSTRARRIVGGANSTPGAWPWQAALYKEGDFQCGATLISSQWLVSAGHCFYHALDDHWVARLGALRRGSNLLSPHEQVRVISHIFIHPGYIDTGFVNDISILRMEEPVRFTDYIRPVCLPPPTADIRDGRLCTVVGWGQLYETGRVFPDTLQQVQLPLVSTEECRKRTLFLPLYRLTNNMFCAGFDRGGRDACLGDSGGPLMCEEPDGRWTLQGVTSNGYGCARANRPGVYTKVARYVAWIDQVVNGTYRNTRRPTQCMNGHRCLLGQCLPKSHVCNGIVECSDGSDERNCTPAAL